MSMNPFFGNLEKQINKSIERALSNTSTSFTNPMAGASVDSSVFLGADLETFKNIVDEGVNSKSLQTQKRPPLRSNSRKGGFSVL